MHGAARSRARSRLALCRRAMGRRPGLLGSLLAHATALLALILAKPSVIPPAGMQVIEVSIVMTSPAITALPSRPPLESPPERLHADAPHATEPVDAANAARAPNWVAASASALGRMPAMSKLYAVLYGKVAIDWGMTGALDCLAFDNGGRTAAASDPVQQQTCKAKLLTVARPASPARRDKNYDPIEPTSPHNIDWVPVLTDWDILLGRMSR